MVIGTSSLDRLLGVTRSQDRFCRALLAVAFEGIVRQRGGEQHQVVEGGQAAFGAHAADVVNAAFGRLVNVGDHVAVERITLFPAAAVRHQVAPVSGGQPIRPYPPEW